MEWTGESIPEGFAATTAHQGADLALVDEDERLTLAELADRVDRIASGLSALGVSPGDVVAYQLPNWWEAATVFLATVRLGAIVHPLLPGYRERELAFMLAESGARVLFIPGCFRGFDHRPLLAEIWSSLPDLEHVVTCREDARAPFVGFSALLESSPASPVSILDARRLALLMYTSGTTAAPKGVMHTHDTLVSEVRSLARVHGLGPGDRTAMPSPVGHISGVIHAILAPALLGTAAVLMDRWEPAHALEIIDRERITYMVGAPTFLQELVDHPHLDRFDTSSLRLFSCGGAPVSVDLIDRARRRLPACLAKRVYGSTEFPTISTTDLNDAASRGADTEGRAIAPAEVRIVTSDGNAAVSGEEGEVQARGPECFVGYTDARLTAECFTGDGWFRTGDLGVLDADGYLRITGRIKDIVVRKGEKISAGEIEDVLASHPDIVEAAVIALPDAASGERVCAVVRLRPGATLSLHDLGSFLGRAGVARHKHPEQLEFLAQLPRTASGKVHKAALRARFGSG